jgi:hypothetical protein
MCLAATGAVAVAAAKHLLARWISRYYNVGKNTYNDPAIKVVSVAERMKAGAEKLSRGRVPASAGAERLKIALWAILAKEPVCRVERSMARFLPLSCKFFEFYECRGTRFIGSRSPVPLHKV